MKNVLIYSTPSCPFCKQAKAFLSERGVPFADIDVAADAVKAQEMIQKSGQMGVPVIDVEGDIVIGFDRDKLVKLLGL